MKCPDLYFGSSSADSPPDPYWANPAIIPPLGPLTDGGTYIIHVMLRNNGKPDAPPTTVELLMSPPTIDIPSNSNHIAKLTYSLDTVEGTRRSGIADIPFQWIACGVSSGGGYLSYLARAKMDADPECDDDEVCRKQCYSRSSPTTDRLTAINSVHVIRDSVCSKSRKSDNGGDRSTMSFAFLATNSAADCQKSSMRVRALDSKKKEDRVRLELLIANRNIEDSLARIGQKFSLPKAVFLGEGRGRERVAPFSKTCNCASMPIPQIGRLGRLDQGEIADLLPPREKLIDVTEGKKSLNLELPFEERRQIILSIDASTKEDDIYAVEVEHVDLDGKSIGGITCIFVPPHNFF